MQVEGSEHSGKEHHEANVGGRGLARREQVVALVGAHGPVVVLAAAVDKLEGLLVHKRAQVVTLCDLRVGASCSVICVCKLCQFVPQ